MVNGIVSNSIISKNNSLSDYTNTTNIKRRNTESVFSRINSISRTASDEFTSYSRISNESGRYMSGQESARRTSGYRMPNSQSDANQALASISDEEKALVRKNNINLAAKFPDGSPKYIVAMGRNDNKYHIYEMNQNGTNAISIARKYCKDGGYNIISSCDGNLSGIRSTGSTNSGNKVFSFDCVSDDLCSGRAKSCNKDYNTCSPLSFDINGDGVKTSDKIISYDIDGDGIKDNIFDSADAVLVFDNNGDGISGEDGSECFGNNTDIDGNGIKDGFKNGFEALKALARKFGLINGINDNVLDENDINFLEKHAGLKIKLNGYNSKAISIKDSGITEINLADTDKTVMEDDFDGNGNQLMHQFGATFKVFGEEREYADIWHTKLK